jgi:hypothetical protein
MVAAVVVRDRVDDLDGVLRRGGVIQEGQRLAVDLLVQDREIPSHGLDVEGGCGGHRFQARFHHLNSRIRSLSGSRPTTSCSACCRIGASPMRASTASAKAKVSTVRAVSSSSPRERR